MKIYPTLFEYVKNSISAFEGYFERRFKSIWSFRTNCNNFLRSLGIVDLLDCVTFWPPALVEALS